MKYPMTVSVQALGPSRGFHLKDADGQLLWHVTGRWTRSQFDIDFEVRGEPDGPPLYAVKADGERDFLRYTPLGSDVTYSVTDSDGAPIGSFFREGGLGGAFRGHYEWRDRAGKTRLTITQENPLTGVVDGIIKEIPLVGPVVAAAVLNASYAIALDDGTVVQRLDKGVFLLQPTFTLAQLADLPPELEPLAWLGAVLLVLHDSGRS